MASDVLMLDISTLTIIADYFVIVTGETDRQLQAIVDHTREELEKDHQVAPLSSEGLPSSGWLLVDYGSVILHVFSPEQRAHYRLEELWSRAKTVVRLV